MDDSKREVMNEIRQEAISILFGMIDSQQLEIGEPDAEKVTEVVTVLFAKNHTKVSREDVRETVADVWQKMTDWLTGE